MIYVKGTNINLELLKDGLAEVYRGRPARGFDNDPYWEGEEEARESLRGMWAQGDKFVSPRDWGRMYSK